MTNSKMLQFQSNSLATIIANWRPMWMTKKFLLNSKVDVGIKMNTYKITNLIVIRKCGMITYANFKVKVNQLLTL